MGLGVYGAVVGNLIDLLPFPANLGDGVFLGVLKLFDDAVHYIDKDDLASKSAAVAIIPTSIEPRIRTCEASQRRSHVQCFLHQNGRPFSPVCSFSRVGGGFSELCCSLSFNVATKAQVKAERPQLV